MAEQYSKPPEGHPGRGVRLKEAASKRLESQIESGQILRRYGHRMGRQEVEAGQTVGKKPLSSTEFYSRASDRGRLYKLTGKILTKAAQHGVKLDAEKTGQLLSKPKGSLLGMRKLMGVVGLPFQYMDFRDMMKQKRLHEREAEQGGQKA